MYHRYIDDAYGDYSIATLSNTPHQIENKTFTLTAGGPPLRITGYVSYPLQGCHYYKYGASSGWAYVKIVDTDYTEPFNNGYTIRGLDKSKIITGQSVAGDSGGPYICRENSRWKLGGVHAGFDGTYTYSTPLGLIIDKGFSPKID